MTYLMCFPIPVYFLRMTPKFSHMLSTWSKVSCEEPCQKLSSTYKTSPFCISSVQYSIEVKS